MQRLYQCDCGCLELCPVPLWDVMKQDFTCHQPCHPLPLQLLGPCVHKTRRKEFLLLPSLQKSMESWDFSKLFCLHCSLFLKNQPSLLMNTACSRNGHPLPFLPRNLETVSKCCSLQLLGSYSVHRAEKKIHWSRLIREVLLELEVCGKSLSLHRFFIDLYMGCADMVFV